MDELAIIRAIHEASKRSNEAFDAAIEAITDETSPKIDILCELANECEAAYEQALIDMIEGKSVECRENLEVIESGEIAAEKCGAVNFSRAVLGMFPS